MTKLGGLKGSFSHQQGRGCSDTNWLVKLSIELLGSLDSFLGNVAVLVAPQVSHTHRLLILSLENTRIGLDLGDGGIHQDVVL